MNKFLSIFGVVATVLGAVAVVMENVAKRRNGEEPTEEYQPIEIPQNRKKTKYIVQRINRYTGEILETEDEIFDNEEDAEFYAEECSAGFAQGEEDFEYANRAFEYADDSEFVVTEIEG